MVTNQEIFGLDNIELYTESCRNAIFGPKMAILSILSDVQHLMEMGELEMARQVINRAKYVMRECLVEKE